MRIHIFLLSSSFKIITSTIYGFQIQHTTSGQNILLDCEFRPFLSSFFFGILLVDYWDSCATGEKKKDIRVNKDKHYCRCKSKRQHLDFQLAFGMWRVHAKNNGRVDVDREYYAVIVQRIGRAVCEFSANFLLHLCLNKRLCSFLIISSFPPPLPLRHQTSTKINTENETFRICFFFSCCTSKRGNGLFLLHGKCCRDDHDFVLRPFCYWRANGGSGGH